MHSVQFVSTVGPGHLLLFFLFNFFVPDINFKKHKHTHEWGHVCRHTLQKCNQRDGCVRTARWVRRSHAYSSCGASARLRMSRPRPSYPSEFPLSPSTQRGGWRGASPCAVTWGRRSMSVFSSGGLFYVSPPIGRRG